MDGEGSNYSPEGAENFKAEQPSSEFSQKEQDKLNFVKDQVEKDKIGGPDDKPKEDFTAEPAKTLGEGDIDAAWKNISPDKREEIWKQGERARVILDIKDWNEQPTEHFTNSQWEARYQQMLELAERERATRETSFDKNYQGDTRGDYYPYGGGFEDDINYDRIVNKEEAFITNFQKGGPREVFYRTLMENYPELGIEVRDDATSLYGEPTPFQYALYINPAKKSEVNGKINKILFTNPIIKALNIFESEPEEEIIDNARRLESQGILPHGAEKKVLAKKFQKSIEIFKDTKDELYLKILKQSQQGLESLGNVNPFTDQEISQILLEKVFTPEFGPPQRKQA